MKVLHFEALVCMHDQFERSNAGFSLTRKLSDLVILMNNPIDAVALSIGGLERRVTSEERLSFANDAVTKAEESLQTEKQTLKKQLAKVEEAEDHLSRCVVDFVLSWKHSKGEQ